MTTLTIDLAGITVALHGGHGEADVWGRRRYAPFLSRRRARWDLVPHVRKARDIGAPRVGWTDGGFTVRMADARFDVDTSRRRIEVQARSLRVALSPSLLRVVSGLLLLDRGGFMIHAAGVADAAHARVFWGPSGSGKTTIAKLAGPRIILNDETIAVRPTRGGWEALATPFFGQGGPAMARVNTRAPLRAGFFLRKAADFWHRRLSVPDAVARLFGQVFLPRDDRRIVERLLPILMTFAAAVPCYELGFRPDARLWEYVDAL